VFFFLGDLGVRSWHPSRTTLAIWGPGNIAFPTIRAVGDLWDRALRDGQAVPYWLLGDFMDDFRLRSETDLERQLLVRDEPAWIVRA
jgi:hypothetical protein